MQAVPFIAIGTQPLLPIGHPYGYGFLNADIVSSGDSHTDVKSGATAVSVQLLHLNRHEWDCLYGDARNTCASI